MENDQRNEKQKTKPSPDLLENVLTEKELLDMFGMNKKFLDYLRLEKKFPFCKVSTKTRLYLVEDVYEYIRSTRTILNRGE